MDEDKKCQQLNTLSSHEERIAGLERYQDKQNGRMERLEDKIERIYKMLITLLSSFAGGLLILLLRWLLTV